MPLEIIRQDITKIRADAIVNPTNTLLYPTGGVDLALHNAAEGELLRFSEEIGRLKPGDAAITPAFGLMAHYVIHTVGPIWQGGGENEEELLSRCYKQCLTLAKENACQSLAFPLIASGHYGFPKERVLKIAIDTISTFLFENEMRVYLCVFDKKAFELSKKLFGSIEEYIDDNYAFSRLYSLNEASVADFECCNAASPERRDISHRKAQSCPVPCRSSKSKPKKSLEEFIKLDESFALKLIKLIDAKGMKDVECYKKANVSKQTWHKLMTDKHYKPNKKTAISFAVALELSLKETQELLSSVGFILSDSSLFDVIIKYCLENEIYDIFEIDSALFKYDQETLFSTI